MGTPGYGDYLLIVTASLAIGVIIGFSCRHRSRSRRVRSLAKVSSILATIPSVSLLVLALTRLDTPENPLRMYGAVELLLGGFVLPFVWIMALIGLPIVIGSAIPKHCSKTNDITDQSSRRFT
ncbi:MAG: hypothetical protein CMO55_15945 [Verrucomicrobiales bacterium]|nr:hypothetical protein [Verrucomicrobiales bacterium]